MAFLIGDGNGNKGVSCSFMEENTWKKMYLPDLITARTRNKVVIQENKMYNIGGTLSDSSFTNKVDMLDLNNKILKWVEVGSMVHKRRDHGAVVIDNNIFVVGGNACLQDGTLPFSNVEMMDTFTGQWKVISTYLGHNLNWSGVGALDDKIYIVGGICSRKVIRFDPFSLEWRRLPDCIFRREKPVVVSHRGLIFVFGGDKWTSRFGESGCGVESFDPVKEKWTRVTSDNPCFNSNSNLSGCIMDRPLYFEM